MKEEREGENEIKCSERRRETNQGVSDMTRVFKKDSIKIGFLGLKVGFLQ